MGASPPISPIWNLKVVTVAFVLVLLLLLPPFANPSDPCCNTCSSDRSCDYPVGEIGSLGCFKAICFTVLPKSIY